MTKFKSVILKALALLFAAVLVCLCFCGCEQPEPEADEGYEAQQMSVTAHVRNDCTVDITEEFTIKFLATSHGMTRALPTNSGERYKNLTAGGDEYELSHDSGFLLVRFGVEDVLYGMHSRPQHYTVSYTMELPEVENDRLLLNLIGNDFDMVRKNVTVQVDFDTPYEKDTLKLYCGVKGSDSLADESRFEIIFASDRKSFVLKTREDVELQPFVGLTLDASFASGTFAKPFDAAALVTWAIGIILAALTLIAKILFARSEKPVAMVNFYPPESESGRQLSPAQAGMLIDNTCSPDDVTSLIFFWASKGCIEIEDEGDDTVLIYKAPLDDGAPDYEKRMFKKLFDRATVVDTDVFGEDKKPKTEKQVRISSLKERFYSSVSSVQSGVKHEYDGKLYKKSNSVLSFAMVVIAVIFAAATVFFAYQRISLGFFNFFSLLFIVPAVLVTLLGQWTVLYKFKHTKGFSLFMSIVCLLAAAAASTAFMFVVPRQVLTLSQRIAIAVCMTSVLVIAPALIKRTRYYNDRLGQLIGFRDFLRLAEKDKLEMLLKENPQYYYDILPYANVLGVSAIWQDKFKSLTVEPPAYYRMTSGDVFTIILFNSMFNRTNTHCRTVMTSRPQSKSNGSSGGGFSRGGGGFSGGGFGGGGSRRW